MEDVLAIYALPYILITLWSARTNPVSSLSTIPCAPGRPERIDDEYVRNGTAEIFLEVEPLTGRRHVGVSVHRARTDWVR